MQETVSQPFINHADKPHRDHPFWGFFLIFAGILLVLNLVGLVPWSVWDMVWRLWPALLIFAGLRMILGDGPASRFFLTFLSFLFFLYLALMIVNFVSPGTLPDIQFPFGNVMQSPQDHAIKEI